MKRALFLAVLLAAAPAHADENMQAERQLCGAHLNDAWRPDTPGVSRYVEPFVSLCEAFEARARASLAAAQAARDARDAAALQQLSPAP